MCLALIAIEQHPQYPIIILSNRDEFYTRATLPAHYWVDDPGLFAGQDLIGGGTWLGVNQKGQFGLVTNYRNPQVYNTSLRSRGILVRDFLQKEIEPGAYLETIKASTEQYNLFNLIIGNLNEIIYFSSVKGKSIQLKPGLYGLSNHLLDTPWYKVVRAKEQFQQEFFKAGKDATLNQIETLLYPILEDHTLAPNTLLPQTGVSHDLEKSLSSIFVNIPQYHYGTRNSSLVVFSKNNIYFSEKMFVEGKMIMKQSQILGRIDN